jgi:hypothetical protein
MPLAFNPIHGLYTRQQIREATGLSLDVIGYWIKEGLLKAKRSEGLGSGKHRQFGFEAIHIAAVLAEVHRFGVGISGLRGIAKALWGAVVLPILYPGVTETDVLDCEELSRARKKYPRRSASEGANGDYCFEDWLDEKQGSRNAFGPKAFELEGHLTPELYGIFALHFDLFSPRTFAKEANGRLFVFRIDDQNLGILSQDVAERNGGKDLPTFISLDISRIIRGIWTGLDDGVAASEPGQNAKLKSER